MEAFDPTPPIWIASATHAYQFQCPTCGKSSREAERVWINRRSPVFLENYRKKLQEFYQCGCGCVWWAWSIDRPPADLPKQGNEPQLPGSLELFDD